MSEFDEDFIPEEARLGKQKRTSVTPVSHAIQRPQNTYSQFPNYKPPLPNATIILVLGIVSIAIWPTGIPCGIITQVLYKKDKLLFDTSPVGTFSDQSVGAMKAGRICGIIGLCISSFFVLIFLCYFIFVFAVFGAIFAGATH